MSAPIFVIQNEDGSESLLLKDDNGIGNAIPTVQGFRDLDIRQDYASGDTGKSPVRLPHEFILSMDYVTEEIRQKLLDWKFQRERVKLPSTVLFGPNTVFAYEPVDITGGGHLDLTGNNNVAAVGDAHLFGYWDKRTKIMGPVRADNQSILVDTEFGQANLATRKAMNRAPNPNPDGSLPGFGAGFSGWIHGDTTPDQTLVVTHVTDGFGGHSLCPDSIRVTAENTNVTAGDIQLWASDYFDPLDADYGGWEPPAACGMWLSIWVKGLFPINSILRFGPDADFIEVDLADYDTSEWTRIDLGVYRATYGDLAVSLNCELQPLTFVNFEIGPVLIVCEDDVEQGSSFGGPGHFTDQVDGATGAATVPCYMTSASFQAPASGTATMFYSVPDDSPLNDNETRGIRPGFWLFPYQTGTGWDGMVMASQRSGNWSVRCIVGSDSEYWPVDASVLWSPGLHALTIVWGNKAVKCYVDGIELEPEDGTMMFAPGLGTMYFNGLSQGPHTGCSLRYHGFSIQDRILSIGEIAGLYGLMADTVARNLVQTAQDRLYEIVSVPSTPLIQDGFTRWLGDLRLRQVKYLGTDPVWFAEDE